MTPIKLLAWFITLPFALFMAAAFLVSLPLAVVRLDLAAWWRNFQRILAAIFRPFGDD